MPTVLTVSNLAYLNGNPMVMLPRFETQRAFEAIEKYKIVNFGAVPAMLVAMLNYPEADKYDTTSLQSVVSGSAPLPESVLKGFEQRFGATIREGYGLSEATTGVSGHREGMVIKPGAVGTPKPNSGIEVQVVDHNDKPLPAHERGEIVVRGPNVMMGYYDNPAATEDTIRNGWLHTGDVGYLDEDGYIYIVERKKDLIIRGGQKRLSPRCRRSARSAPGGDGSRGSWYTFRQARRGGQGLRCTAPRPKHYGGRTNCFHSGIAGKLQDSGLYRVYRSFTPQSHRQNQQTRPT